MGGVVGVGLEVDVAAILGPVAGQAVAGLVCAESSIRFRQRLSKLFDDVWMAAVKTY